MGGFRDLVKMGAISEVTITEYFNLAIKTPKQILSLHYG